MGGTERRGVKTNSSSHLLPPLSMFRLIELAEDMILPRLHATRTVKPCSSRIWRANGTHMGKESRGGSHEIIRSESDDWTYVGYVSIAFDVRVDTHHVSRKRPHTTGESVGLEVHRCAILRTSLREMDH